MPTRSQGGSLAALVHHLLEEPGPQARVAMVREAAPGLALIHALKDEVDSYKNADGARALLAGQRALEASAHIDDPLARPLGHWAMALGLTVQGHYREALEHFRDARSGYAAAGLDADADRVATREIQARAMMGDYSGALLLGGQIRDSFARAGMVRDAAQVDNNLGIIHSRLGQFQEAEAALRRAERGFAEAADRSGVAMAQMNLGYAYQEADRFSEARDRLEEALAAFEALEQTNLVAGLLVDLASLYRREGNPGRVLELLSRARALYDGLEASADAAMAQLEEARIHLDLNLLDEAERMATELVTLFSARQMRREQVEALAVLGNAQARGGKRDEAQATLERARHAWLEIGNPIQAALTDLSLAALQLHAPGSEPQTAAATVALVTAAQRTLQAEEMPAAAALASLLLAEALLADERLAEAGATLREVHPQILALGHPELAIRSLRLLGRLALRDGRRHEAERHFADAVEQMEAVRASLQVDEFKSAYLGDKLALYGDLVALLLAEGRDREAFSYAERAKSRALLDLLARGVDPQPDSDDPEVARLGERLRAEREALNWQRMKAEAGHDASTWERVRAGEQRVVELIRELERLRPEAASLEGVSPPDIEALTALLPADTLLLEYFAADDELSAFIVGREELRAVPRLGSLAAVRGHLERIDFLMKRVAQGGVYAKIYPPAVLGANIDEHLGALYDLLIAPLGLEEHRGTLMVVPHGAVHAVPFAALHDGDGYLIDRVRLALAPSAAVYRHCLDRRSSEEGTLVAFGVPQDDLPAVGREIAAIADGFGEPHIFIDADATRERFFRYAPEAGVLHLATHGVFRPDNPMFSGLRLGDGWLTARDLYSLRLTATLTVLSACESGLSHQGQGDELFGLARGFLYAGTPALVASLWPVKDEQTTELMGHFYRQLQAGTPVAGALRSAQQALRALHPNPYYWGAFTLIGDPDRTLPRRGAG